MRFYIIIIIVSINVYEAYGQLQIEKEKFDNLAPILTLSIWDEQNSAKTLKIDTLSYDEIPKYLDFKGTVVESLKWTDNLGDNILILTVTGHFYWKDYFNDSSDYMLQDKSELYGYLFQKKKGHSEFSRIWRLYDYTECFGVDWFAGFISNATTITDLDNDGISEVSLPYVLICRGDVSPGTMKIIMYVNNTKYALRGNTKICIDQKYNYGGEFEPSENLISNQKFMDFLINRWDIHKCENDKYE